VILQYRLLGNPDSQNDGIIVLRDDPRLRLQQAFAVGFGSRAAKLQRSRSMWQSVATPVVIDDAIMSDDREPVIDRLG
jgi:hypothetical protein